MVDITKYTNAFNPVPHRLNNDDIVRCPKCGSDNVGCCYRTNTYVTKTCYNCGFQMSGEPDGVFITWNKLLDEVM